MAFQSPADLNFKTEKVILEKFMFGVTSSVSRQVLKDLARRHSDLALRQGALYTDLSPITDEMLLHMRAFMLKSQHTEKETISVESPATWFDHLKYDWLNSGVSWKVWAAGKLAPPVIVTKSKTVDKITRVCPHYDSYLSENQMHIEWLLWRHDMFDPRWGNAEEDSR
jgi:hypothetical protein